MRLSPKEQTILAAVEFDAEVPLAEYARRLRISTASVHYTINDLLDRKVIRRYPFINSYALGYSSHLLYFSPTSEVDPEALLTAFRRAPMVSWLAEMGGAYQYCATVLCRDLSELANFLDHLADRMGNCFAKKCIVNQLWFTLFQTKYLYTKGRANEFLTWKPVAETFQLDDLDRRILAGLLSEDLTTCRGVARSLGVAVSTFDWRLKRLQERGIILRFLYLLSPLTLQMNTFKLLLYTRGFTSKHHTQLFDYCHRHPKITTLIRCIGNWDYELGVEVSPASELVEVVKELRKHFGANVAAIEELNLEKMAAIYLDC